MRAWTVEHKAKSSREDRLGESRSVTFALHVKTPNQLENVVVRYRSTAKDVETFRAPAECLSRRGDSHVTMRRGSQQIYERKLSRLLDLCTTICISKNERINRHACCQTTPGDDKDAVAPDDLRPRGNPSV